MPFVKKHYKVGWYIKDNRIYLTKEFFENNWNRFTKLTGSKFADVIGESEYSSPVKIWATICKIYGEQIDKIYKDAGKYIEPKIRPEVEKKLDCKYQSYVSEEVGYDVFRDTHPILGGIPDGEPLNNSGQVDYSIGIPMLEIKTASIDSFKRIKNDKNQWVVELDANNVPIVKEANKNKDKWFKDGQLTIPQNYIDQLSLYLYLRNATKGIFAVVFLKPEDYADLEKVDISTREVYYKEITLDRTEFEKVITKAIKWYKGYVLTGISPIFNEKDIKWLKEEGVME